MNPQSLVNKLDGVLGKYAPPDRTATKRLLVREGTDELTGIPGTQTSEDTVFAPQPFYSRLGREKLTGGHARFENVVNAAGSQMLADDYIFIFTSTAMSADDLANPDIVVVLTADNGAEETFRLVDFESAGFSGQDVAYICYMRSTKRTVGVS
jgi:hypothetical protein